MCRGCSGLGLIADAARALSEALAANSRLTALDLSANNLSFHDVLLLCRGIAENRALRSLALRANRFGTPGAAALADLVR